MKQVPNLRTLVLIDIGSHECHYEHKKAIIEIICILSTLSLFLTLVFVSYNVEDEDMN